ncbi:hypothetical protein BGZ49_000439, partial [Haplosporangium sp. Z 27]
LVLSERTPWRTINSKGKLQCGSFDGMVDIFQSITVPNILQRISINFGYVDAALEEWIASLDDHTGLEHLEFNYSSYISPSMKAYYPKNIGDQEAILGKESMDEMGESHLREFSFDSNNKEINWLILVSLLENAPFLDHLRLPVLCDEEPFHKVAQILQHGDNNVTDANGLQSLEVKVCPGMGTYALAFVVGAWESQP